MQKYLFIAGCARSGTSALAQLIGSHNQVVIGMERFGHLVTKDKFTLSEEHFTSERFLNIEPGDTFYNDFEKFHSWDENIIRKLNQGNLEYIGDKRPELYMVYDELIETFPNSKIIFIYRNIFDVAASWNKRAEEGINWPMHKNFKKAVHTWNYSLKTTIKAIQKYPDNICCIKYEDVLVDAKELTPLYNWLELNIDENTKTKQKNILMNSKRLQEERKNFALSEDQQEYCNQNADYKLEEQLNSTKLV